MNEQFHCHQCWLNAVEISHEKLYQFGNFGNNELKKEDHNWYCKPHFTEKEEEYKKE